MTRMLRGPRSPWHAIGGRGAAVLLGAMLPCLFGAIGIAGTARGQAATIVLSVTLIGVGIAPHSRWLKRLTVPVAGPGLRARSAQTR